MFFCPNCNNSFDIKKSSGLQKGGVENTESSTITTSQTGGDRVDDLIEKILQDEEINKDDINGITLQDLSKNNMYKRLKSKQKEIIYNKIQDMLPKEEKKIVQEQIDVKEDDIYALFECTNCGYLKKIDPGTRIFSKSAKTVSQNYTVTDYKDMIYSDILPRTKRYVCPNDKCISHKDISKKKAVFMRLNNSNIIKYICTACNTDFSI